MALPYLFEVKHTQSRKNNLLEEQLIPFKVVRHLIFPGNMLNFKPFSNVYGF